MTAFQKSSTTHQENVLLFDHNQNTAIKHIFHMYTLCCFIHLTNTKPTY
eukprot:UN01870